MRNLIIVGVLAAVIFGAGGFFAGRQFQQKPIVPMRRFNNNQNGNGAVVRGEILNMGDHNLTVKLPDGSSKLVLISGSTAILETVTASQSALQTGKQVTVLGNNNPDGSVTATNVQTGRR